MSDFSSKSAIGKLFVDAKVCNTQIRKQGAELDERCHAMVCGSRKHQLHQCQPLVPGCTCELIALQDELIQLAELPVPAHSASSWTVKLLLLSAM